LSRNQKKLRRLKKFPRKNFSGGSAGIGTVPGKSRNSEKLAPAAPTVSTIMMGSRKN
jgi:hypothetical protein